MGKLGEIMNTWVFEEIPDFGGGGQLQSAYLSAARISVTPEPNHQKTRISLKIQVLRKSQVFGDFRGFAQVAANFSQRI